MRSLEPAPGRRGEAGFSLAETIVAMALTLGVVAAAFNAFSGAMGLAELSRVTSDTNQGMQAAMSLLVRDFIQAGQGIPLGGIPIPSGGGSTAVKRPGPPGSTLTYPAAWTAMPAVSPGGSLGPLVLGVTTDLVTVFYADPTIALNQYPLAAIAADGSSMTVDNRTSITGADGLHVGDIIMFANAQGNAMQMITKLNGGQVVSFEANDALNLNQRGAAQGSILHLQAGAGVFPPTTATRVLMINYYIDAVTDPSLPRLTRQVNAGSRLAIALGVENLQFSYDLVDGITNPSNLESVAAPYSPNQIRKANLFLSARSLEQNIHSRQYYRNSMATQVGFRSLSFVDRYK